ncbi:predicted protein [Botrytis cinerea T4]|uniref:Uncharacterized protein n=1 Tax=Botryotinia fuckeliana (strain T4) TaxID=999810 RepID=G2YXI0_BOTF4|nr:predicted protein [Botrytis cinerea T4]
MSTHISDERVRVEFKHRPFQESSSKTSYGAFTTANYWCAKLEVVKFDSRRKTFKDSIVETYT